MKHWHVVNRFRFTVFMTAVILTICTLVGLAFGAYNASGSTEQSYETITIQAGDTRWSIAEEYAPAGQDVRNYIYEICDKNNIEAGDLIEGQDLVIPVK